MKNDSIGVTGVELDFAGNKVTINIHNDEYEKPESKIKWNDLNEEDIIMAMFNKIVELEDEKIKLIEKYEDKLASIDNALDLLAKL